METSTERKRDDGKPEFLLTGFTQTAGIRIYAFDGRVGAQRIHYTVTVDLGLIPGYGIRIQELPLLCREVLQQGGDPDEKLEFVFTEQQMRLHAEKLATAREDAEHKRKQPRHLASGNAGAAWRAPLR